MLNNIHIKQIAINNQIKGLTPARNQPMDLMMTYKLKSITLRSIAEEFLIESSDSV